MPDPSLEALPIDAVLPDIVAGLRAASGLVVHAPPGAGKTTRVPRALYDAGFAATGEILILEPRRLAARLAAARVAAGFGESLGRTVGFTIRFESISGPGTRIRFVTEGILSRRIVRDPLLQGISTVILDEFHERHLPADLALAFLRRLQQERRPDLRLLVMSATLNAEPVADFLGGAPIVRCEGANFDIALSHAEREEDRPLHEKVVMAVSTLGNEPGGDVLIFLPGAAEIRRAAEALRGQAARAGLGIFPLHGDLPAAAQDRALQPATRPKLILATNVAETSITIPGIAAVIDSGLARVAGYSSWSGLPILSLAKISKASARQRAGRAGRTRAGRVLRLYTRRDFETRPEHDLPEIKRADLAESALTLHGAGLRDLRSFAWFEPPAESAWSAAEDLLRQLGALDALGAITPTGRKMAEFPLHPRLARLVIEGERRGVAAQACLLAAVIAERDMLLDARSRMSDLPRTPRGSVSESSDLLERMERYHAAERSGFTRDRMAALDLDPRGVEAVNRARRQLVRLAGRGSHLAAEPEVEEALGISILAAFPDRVARRRAPGGSEFLLAAGGSARLAESSIVQSAPLITAVDAEMRTGEKGTRDASGVLIRIASAVEPEWLAGLFPEDINRQVACLWNEQGGRVDETVQTRYRTLVLEESTSPARPSEAVSRILFQNARGKGLAAFRDGDRVPGLVARAALLAKHFPTAALPTIDEEGIAAACAQCCTGHRSLVELSRVSLADMLQARFSSQQRDLLRRETPDHFTLPGGRKLPIHYEPGRTPWIASLLQDFFGMKTTPAICAGRLPLTIHLLAPNRRPVQVTQDLAGFWERHYPDLRRQLQRRYPKHRWPE